MSDTRSQQELLPSGHSTCEHILHKHPSWFLEVIPTGPAYGIASVLTYYFPYCRAGIPFQSTSTQGGLLYVGDTVTLCISTIQMFHLQARSTQPPARASQPWPYMHGLWHATLGRASFKRQVEPNLHLCFCTIVPQMSPLFAATVCLHGRK